MTTTARLGNGTVVTHAQFVGNLLSVDGPEITAETVDVSNMSTEDYKEFIGQALKDAGQVDLTVQFDPATVPVVGGTPSAFTITWAGGAVWSMDAVLISFKPGARIGEVMEAQASFKISGEITVTPAAG